MAAKAGAKRLPAWAAGLSLTVKQIRFIEAYVSDLGRNATQAAIAAGYAADTANREGFRLLRKPNVIKALDALLEAEGVSRFQVLNELAKVAYANFGDFAEWDGKGITLKSSDDLTDEQKAAVAEVAQTWSESEKGSSGSIKLKLHNKLDAIEKLAKIGGLLRDRVEVSGPNGGPVETKDVTDAERVQALAFLAAREAKNKQKEAA